MKTMRLLLPLAAAAIVTFVCGCEKKAAAPVKKDSGPVAVRLQPVETKIISRVVDSVGTFFPFDETVISAEVDGKVLKVNFDLGDTVKKGQTLVQLSDEEQRYLLDQDQAQLRSSMERLGLKSPEDRVQDINQTSEVRAALADLADAETRYKRVKGLLDQGLAPQADADAALARFRSTQAAYDQAVKQIRNLIQETERFKATVALQQKRLRDTAVLAPFDALVKERTVTPGQFLRANSPLLTLVRIDPIRLRIEIPERMAPWVKTGQLVDISVEAFAGRKFSGRIARIAPTVDQSKRTFIVEALIPNGNGDLKPGSYARARVPTDMREEVRVVPARAINYVFGSNKAYVVKNNVVEARDVKLGDRFEQQVEVLEGLAEGDVIALTRLNQLDTGVKVRPESQQARAE